MEHSDKNSVALARICLRVSLYKNSNRNRGTKMIMCIIADSTTLKIHPRIISRVYILLDN